MTYKFKTLLLAFLSIILVNCNNDNGDDTNITSSKTILYAVDGIGSDLKIVEVNQLNGNLESVLINFEPQQARTFFDFTYLNTTNQLLIRKNVFEGGIGSQLLKINIDTKEQSLIASESFTTIVAGDGRLFGLIGLYDVNSLQKLDIVEINPENTSIISRMELYNNSDNSRAEISNILYSQGSGDLLVPIRTTFDSNTVNELIIINSNLTTKKIIPINGSVAVTTGNNNRVFAVKRVFDPDLNEITFFGVVEVDIDNGNELSILKVFDNNSSFVESEIIFLNETNEVLVDIGTLYKINVDNKSESILENGQGFYSFRSVNIY